MKRKILFWILIIIMVLATILLTKSASAWQNTTFNNSLTDEILTFSSKSSFIRYLTVPQNTFITNGYFNITYPVGQSNVFLGLVTYYDLNESSGTTIDRATGINNGTTNGVTYGATGIIDKAYNFDGTDDWINISYNQAFNFTGKNLSISLWVNSSAQTGTNDLFYQGEATTAALFSQVPSDEAVEIYIYQLDGTPILVDTVGTIGTGTFRHIAATTNGSDFLLYIDGILNTTTAYDGTIRSNGAPLYIGTSASDPSGESFNGIIDEIGLWNRSLSQAEITNLYNSGNAKRFIYGQPPSVGQINLSIGNSLFENLNISNTGYLNSTFQSSNLNSYINTYLNSCTYISGLCQVPFNFSSDVGGVFLHYHNLSFGNIGISVNNQNFNNNTVSLSSETFKVNVTYDSNNYGITSTLIYNNTRYSVASSGSGNNRLFSKTIVIPSVSAQTNKTFYWEFALSNTTTTDYFNSTKNNQSITTFNIDDCSSFTELILNYTLEDEEDVTFLNETDYNTTIEVDALITSIQDSSQTIQYNKTYSNQNPALICVPSGTLTNGTWRFDVQTKYTAVGYVVEFHNIQNATLNNNSFPQNIELFPLLSVDSQEFLVTFKDLNFVTLDNALITVTRKYIGEGKFRTVEAPLTNTDGQALIHLVLGDVIYTIQVSKNGVLLATFENIVPFCLDLTTGDCTLNLNAFSTGVSPTDFENVNNLTYKFEIDRDLRIITSTFSTLDGSTASINMTTKVFDGSGNTTICSDIVQTSSGSIICNIPTTIGNTTIQSILYKDGNYVATTLINLQDFNDTGFGYSGILMMAILFITIPLMMITSGIGIVIGGMLGLIFAALLNLYTGGGIIGIGSTIIWFIITGGILIWKINSIKT